MRPFFRNPSNTNATGVIFLKSIIFKEIFYSESKTLCNRNKLTTIFLIKRFFSRKEDEKLMFLPLSWLCFFARKGDMIILPDDSLRSISSVAKVRFSTKSYLKGFYQIYRYIITYILLLSLRRCVLYTVSIDDLNTLTKQFPANKIKYLPHPIQSQYNGDTVYPVAKSIIKVGFVNLQEHYSLKPDLFLVKTKKLNNKKIVFHGGYSKNWFDYAKEIEFGVDLYHEKYIDDFEKFFSDIDVVVMPLVAGAGIKNILLNSIYRNKYVFGTKEAFSGIPVSLSHPFIVNDSDLLIVKLEDIDALRPSFNRLRAYILEHHSISEFKLVLNKRD